MITDIDVKLAAACAGTYAAGAVPQWQGRDERVHVYLSEIDGTHVIAFEGTTSWEGRSSFQEWLIDFDACPVQEPGRPYGLVHQGILFDVMSVIDPICAYLEGLGWPTYLATGHSKGGGEVTLFHAEMKHRGHPPAASRAYEPPQVGGHALRDYLSGEDHAWTATVNSQGRDCVTLVPGGLQLPYFTEWSHINDPILLSVPDELDMASKHRIAAVQGALGRQSASP